MQKWWPRSFPRRLKTTGPLALAASAFLSLPLLLAVAAQAADSVPLPFVDGEAVRVIQGYNGGTHQGASIYGLDLVLANGETSGAPVLSPLDGSVTWAFAPGDRTGCIQFVDSARRWGVMLCHVLLDRPYNRGERVARGQQIGTVGSPGTVGNNGTAHVHMELHLGGSGTNAVPFGSPDGLPLEGQDLPVTGASNDHAGVLLTSSNTISVAPPQPTPTPPSRNAATPRNVVAQNVTRCAPGVKPAFGQGFAALKAQLGSTMGDATTCEYPDPKGTGDVLQQTTSGLAFWRKTTNTPTFTDGFGHWGSTPSGWVTWVGDSIDPPVSASLPGEAS